MGDLGEQHVSRRDGQRLQGRSHCTLVPEENSTVKGFVVNGAWVEAPIDELRELDRRSGNGIDVMLAWEPATNHVFVGVIDSRTGTEFAIRVDPVNALDAFYHPFAYEPCRVHDEYVGAEI
jgi:hypothetical protein